MALRKIRDAPLPSSIIPTLAAYPDLSQLFSFINGSTNLYNLLNGAENFTFLAPTNDAITQWITTQENNSTPSADVIEATLSYHLLNGSWPTVNFKTRPQFVVSDLTDVSYSNVTGGQRVELQSGPNGNPEFLSDNRTLTTISAPDVVCLNGLIQVVNSVLVIPTSVVLLTAQAHMSNFIAILNRANFLSVNDSGVIDFVNYASFTPDMTFFVPNSADALTAFNNMPGNISAADLTALFDYHIVPNNVFYSSDFVNGTVLTTTQGSNVTITTVGNDTYVNDAKIVERDYMVVNGVIHTIDSILDRFNQTIPPQAIASPAPSSTNSTSPSASSSGLSTGARVAIGVAVPVVILTVLAGIFFWFWRWRKRKAAQAQARAELGAREGANEVRGGAAAKELGTNDPAANEIYTNEQKRELYGDNGRGELPSEVRPQELHTGMDRPPLAEME